MNINIVHQGNINKASEVLDEALKKTTLGDINESAVIRLKNKLEAMGQTFKYDTNALKKRVCNINYWIF